MRHGVTLVELRATQPSLEDTFLTMTTPPQPEVQE
jgi:hypothetical protein